MVEAKENFAIDSKLPIVSLLESLTNDVSPL